MSERMYLVTVEDESVADENALRQLIQTARFCGFEIREHRERTCRNVAPSYLRFMCSQCGHVIYHDDANEIGDRDQDTPNFCPHCGAKVVAE